MPITNTYEQLSPSSIIVKRSERQRSEIDTSDIEQSIASRGVLQPVVVEKILDTYLLIAGERRVLASLRVNLPTIPARICYDLTETERQIIELIENVHRVDLDWKDQVRAIRKVHAMFKSNDEAWTHEKTADAVNLDRAVVSIMLRVGDELTVGNPLVTQAGGLRPAYNIVVRRDERRVDDAMNDLLSETSSPLTVARAEGGTFSPPVPQPVAPEAIRNSDFLKWAPLYGERPFNFIHCDFPYGINIDKSDQSNIASYGTYGDTKELYLELCYCLAKNLNRLMTQSGHLMFWLSSDIERQYETIRFFEKEAPSLEFQTVPLTWHKTDNKGILPDPNRGPRRITETALIASRGDRFIIKAVSNCYGSPTTKELHQSEKPEPMLRHFFQMFVDENTRALDPTCGSGSALRAAESLGAKEVLGLEMNQEFVEGARSLLKKSRNLRKLERASHGKTQTSD